MGKIQGNLAHSDLIKALVCSEYRIVRVTGFKDLKKIESFGKIIYSKDL
jgi:hypothetical protein